jgi:hypothetical protein
VQSYWPIPPPIDPVVSFFLFFFFLYSPFFPFFPLTPAEESSWRVLISPLHGCRPALLSTLLNQRLANLVWSRGRKLSFPPLPFMVSSGLRPFWNKGIKCKRVLNIPTGDWGYEFGWDGTRSSFHCHSRCELFTFYTRLVQRVLMGGGGWAWAWAITLNFRSVPWEMEEIK